MRETVFQQPVKRWFEYHCWESEDSTDAELWRRTHSEVDVLGTVESDEVLVLRVRFADGFEGDAWADELLKSPTEFERPNYRHAS